MITRMQDEVHRFAITFSRKKHISKSLKSSLNEIDGVGPSRAKALLKHFKTITAVRNASTKELENVKGITKNVAEAIYKFYNE